jgi:hypothetical protein
MKTLLERIIDLDINVGRFDMDLADYLECMETWRSLNPDRPSVLEYLIRYVCTFGFGEIETVCDFFPHLELDSNFNALRAFLFVRACYNWLKLPVDFTGAQFEQAYLSVITSLRHELAESVTAGEAI